MLNHNRNKYRVQKAVPNTTFKDKILGPGFIAALIIVIILAAISLFTGQYDILNTSDGKEMFFITRVPRTVSLMLAGSAMSICGLVMQLITQNRFVEPTTTGTTEWAGLGLLAVYAFNPIPSLFSRMIVAIIFSFIGTMIFFLFLRRIRLKSSLMVPIIGIMMGAVISSFSTFLSLELNLSQAISSWFQGSFSTIERGRYEFLWAIIIITIIIYIFADKLTLAGLGEDITTSLGANYNSIILIGTALVSIAVGIVSAVIGNLPFLGIIVPNIVSRYRGDHLKNNLPWVALIGMATMLITDIISRIIIAPFELPVSLILGTVGSAVFIYLLLNTRRKKYGK